MSYSISLTFKGTCKPGGADLGYTPPKTKGNQLLSINDAILYDLPT